MGDCSETHMAEHDVSIEQFRRLRVEAAETRSRAVRSQISFAFTLCALAETELGYRHRDEASKLMRKVRHIADTVCRHLEEPNHVPPNRAGKVRDELGQLESRILAIEARLSV
jgi:hypothetical protein